MPPEAGQGAPGAGAGQGSPGAGGAGAGAGAAGAGAGSSNAGAGVNNPGAGAPAPEWYGSFSDTDLKSYAQNKGWKDPSEAVNSYRQLEKLNGVPQERLLKLPEKADDPAWADINTKLGVPKDPKEYAFDVPKEYGDQGFADKARDWFHKNGVPKAKAEAIVKNWNEYVGAQINAGKEAYAQESQKQLEGLKKEWGAAFDQNVKMGKMAALAFGFDETKINQLQQVMGFDGVMKFMHDLQTKIGEDKFVGGGQNRSSFGGIMTPDQAKSQIKLRQQDVEFKSRLMKKDSTAIEEWNTLHKYAFPEPS